MRVAELLASSLAQAGIRHAFGIPGGEILGLIDALPRSGIRYVTARHETAAGLMAEGTWADTGAPALLVVTVGPGLSNAVNAIANAYLDRVPMIVVSASTAPEQRAAFTHQVFDQGALLAPITKASFALDRANAESIVKRALDLALSYPQGPVHLDLPVNVATADALTVSQPGGQADIDNRPLSSPCSELPVESAVEWLLAAERPLILAGLEAVAAGVSEALTAFARQFDLPVLTTYKAKGVLDEHDPRAVGAIALSPRADAIARELIARADTVLLVGYDPVEMRAAYARPFRPGTRVMELAASSRTHGMHEAAMELVGSIASNLNRIGQELEGRLARTAARPHWPDGTPARVRSALREAFAPAVGSADLTPEAVAHTLARTLPPDLRVTLDTGAHRILVSQTFRASRPGQLLQSNGLCTMGYALPCAIGLSISSDRPVLAVMGDGGFEMVVGELATLRDLDLPVTLVVFDDQSLALIDLKQRAEGLAPNGVWLGATDHVAVARAFGGQGVRVTDAQSLACALRDALARRRGFTVISCALARGAYEGRL